MILERIIEKKREEIKRRKSLPLPDDVLEIRDFKRAILRKDGINLVAEIKYASPTAGSIGPFREPSYLAEIYEKNGASAISCVTEKSFFSGDCRFLKEAKSAVSIPVLRKDFVIDPWQIKESLAFGADAILLIATCLKKEMLIELQRESEKAGIATVIEVHTEEDIEKALDAGAEIIGINNRNLSTFEVDIETTARLKPYIPEEVVVISESGIKNREDVVFLEEKGVDALLVGEAILSARNIPAKMKELLSGSSTT
jgi:indole-3-glycerol phosphate synthase